MGAALLHGCRGVAELGAAVVIVASHHCHHHTIRHVVAQGDHLKDGGEQLSSGRQSQARRGAEGRGLTVKALGSVLLHLQCWGKELHRKFGLSVCTRPLGGAEPGHPSPCSSSRRLLDDGVCRLFTTGSNRQKCEEISTHCASLCHLSFYYCNKTIKFNQISANGFNVKHFNPVITLEINGGNPVMLR